MHCCVNASSGSVPLKFCCYFLHRDSNTLFARIHRNLSVQRLIREGLILCDNFPLHFADNIVNWAKIKTIFIGRMPGGNGSTATYSMKSLRFKDFHCGWLPSDYLFLLFALRTAY